jgi:hypothetical protein
MIVDALNAVDTSYRAEFRELFSSHFGQLRAETDKLAVELRSEMKQLEAGLKANVDIRIARLEGRMDAFQEKATGDLKAMKSELVGWMVGLWFVSVALAILARAWTG